MAESILANPTTNRKQIKVKRRALANRRLLWSLLFYERMRPVNSRATFSLEQRVMVNEVGELRNPVDFLRHGQIIRVEEYPVCPDGFWYAVLFDIRRWDVEYYRSDELVTAPREDS